MNKANITKYVLTITLVIGTMSQPVIASSLAPKTIYRDEKASTLTDTNSYPNQPDWTYFPTLTQADKDAVEQEIRGFDQVQEFTPKEIEQILKLAEATNTNPELVYENKLAPVNDKSGKRKYAMRNTNLTPATHPYLCIACDIARNHRYANINSLRTHTLKKHCSPTGSINNGVYKCSSKPKKQKLYMCNTCGKTVERITCVHHMIECAKSNKPAHD